MKIKILSAGVSSLLVVACASITDVVPAGKDTYVIAGDGGSYQATSGASLKTSLYKEANAHCETMGKKLLPLDESTFSHAAELRFRCLDENDPEYRRPVMQSVPDVKIETN